MKTDLNTKVAEWYDESFGMDTEFKDDMGKYIDDKITFKDVADCIENKPNEFYSLTGVSDSVVRERVFAELAKILGVGYDRIYDRWLDKSAPSLYESQQIVEERLALIRMNIVQSYVLEGKTLDEAIKLAEDTITPDTVYRVPQLPGYKAIRNKVEHFFKVCDDIIDYKQSKEYLDDPIGAFQAEADFCDDVADFLGSINLKGFDKEFVQDFMKTTGKDVDHLDNVVDGLEDTLKKQDRSTYVDDSGKAKPRTSRRPGEAAKEALRSLRNFFTRFGLEFDYNPDFDYKTTKDVDYKHLVADAKEKR